MNYQTYSIAILFYCNQAFNFFFRLPFSSFYIALMKSNISATHMLAAMNGNIVALCGTDLDEDISTEEKETLKYPMVMIKPPLCTCYGYGSSIILISIVFVKNVCLYYFYFWQA